jgi:hypothetical protein
MLRRIALGGLVLLLTATALAQTADEPAARPAAAASPAASPAGAASDWHMNATIIEACSCPMFCQCYFDSKPAAHGGAHAQHGGPGAEHFCRFNNAYQVNSGNYGETKLDGAKFWVGGDLGGDFSQGKMDWAHLFFDPSVTPAQRDGIKAILAHVYPVQWGSFTVGPDAKIDWSHDKTGATAKADGGRVAEVALKPATGTNDAAKPIVMHNLKYWGTPRNEGFVMMPNTVEALRAAPAGKEPFEFKGTNGFMITFDIKDEDVKPAAAKQQAKAGGE